MCGRRREQVVREQPSEGRSYTGETLRLGSWDGAAMQSHSKPHFPFWLLWLSWPLIGVLKVAVFWVIANLALLAQWSVPVWPLVLIGLGV